MKKESYHKVRKLVETDYRCYKCENSVVLGSGRFRNRTQVVKLNEEGEMISSFICAECK